MPDQPLLYTFRRCPYAIRARMAISVAGVHVTEQEVALREKPATMLAHSPKGTVPVLVCADGRVIDESLDIMRWALAQHDPEAWFRDAENDADLIRQNDGPFKLALDRYKYPQRYVGTDAISSRAACETILNVLEGRLAKRLFLAYGGPRLVDVCLFPFVRQFAAVDATWFAQAPYPHLRRWLLHWTTTVLFKKVMAKPTN